MKWYVETFGELYPRLYRHRDDASASAEVRGLVALMGASPPARLLDICCGTGRHMAALLQFGFEVTGVDLSAPQLACAADRDGFGDRLVRADVLRLPFDACFDGAVNLFTSFGYFESDADNAAALRSMAATLRPGGVLALDLAHRERLERVIEPLSRDMIDGMTVESRRSIAGNRSLKETVVTGADGRVRTFHESVRLYTPGELAAMFRDSGLRDARFYGHFDGRPLDAVSPRMIVLGARA